MMFILLFIFALVVQLYFLVNAYRRLKKYRPRDYSIFEDFPSVSVIICAHNEAHNIKRNLPKVLDQSYPDFEVLVVNDRSTDMTQSILEHMSGKYSYLRIKYIKETPGNIDHKKYALNMGVAESKKQILVFTDADCWPVNENWLKSVVAQFRDGDLVIGYSPYLKKPGLLNAFIQHETQLTGVLYLGAALSKKPYMAVGRNLAYKRTLIYEEIKSLSHQQVTGGDDDLLINQLPPSAKVNIVLSKESTIYSTPKRNLKSFLRQKIRHLSVSKHYKAGNKIYLTVFYVTFILFYIVMPFLFKNLIELGLVFGGYFIKILIQLNCFKLLYKHSGHKQDYFWAPLTDMMYVFYLMFLGPYSWIRKINKWN